MLGAEKNSYPRILHVLSQRPGRTGSGVTLKNVVRLANEVGVEQCVVFAAPLGDWDEELDDFPVKTRPLFFESKELAYPIPGMSDVMPYRSTRWSDMTPCQLQDYRNAWKRHLREVAKEFEPDLIYCHHLWILSSMMKELFGDLPVLTHCHGTGFRQMYLCPWLAEEVLADCRRNDRFLALHQGHRDEMLRRLRIEASAVDVVGAGYREDLFRYDEELDQGQGREIVYAGKLAQSKGLSFLLDALEILLPDFPDLRLNVAGSGAGEEAEKFKERMRAMGDSVVVHGQLEQRELARLFSRSRVFVLPSLYEGLPLVLIEALACSCFLVCTRLPGVERELEEPLKGVMRLVDPPPMVSIDKIDPRGIAQFVEGLSRAIRESLLESQQRKVDQTALQGFSWRAVFRRIQAVWEEML